MVKGGYIMKYLVTGAFGFVGSVLINHLIEQGHRVIAVDSGRRGLNQLKPHVNLETYKQDCEPGLKEILQVKQPQVVVHLAAQTGSLSLPYAELAKLNIDMTKLLYEECETNDVRVFVFPTTSLAEYVPDSAYVKTKEDAMAWLLEQKGSMQILPLRFFNQIGAKNLCTEWRKDEVHILPIMVKAFIEKKPFIINGNDWETKDGSPSRDYVNINDTCGFIIHMCGSIIKGTFKLNNKIIEVGTGHVTTTLELIEKFREQFGDLQYEWGPRRAFDTGTIQSKNAQLFWSFCQPVLPDESLKQEVSALLQLMTKVEGEA